MGHIKEPKDVDLIINGKPLTKEEEAAISKYIKEYKTKTKPKHSSKQSKKYVTQKV